MNQYTKTILEACIAFPFAAFFFTLPYMIYQYRKFGAILPLRVVIVYSLILYSICAFFMVILPLPSYDEVSAMTSPYTQLIPFRFVADFFKDSGFKLTEPATYLKALKSGQFIVVFFNVLLFVPLGVYLRYYFERKWYQTLLIGLAVSLFFELTQLSGLYGIYPRPYRMCDVDDLILNTAGAMLGYLLAKPFMRILPNRERLDELSFDRGHRVSLTRRLTAAFIDWTILGSLGVTFEKTAENSGSNLVNAGFIIPNIVMTSLVFFIIPIITKGYTPGKALVKIKLAKPDGTKPEFYRYLIRYGILYFGIIPLPLYSVGLFTITGEGSALALLLGSICLLFSMIVWFKFMIRFFKTGAKKENYFWYEKVSGIKNINTVVHKAEN